ncbi:IBR domain-containing protein [Diplocarpon mali]|nr:IBR domain-containing protein [Diplocarpon mali]
MNNPTDQEDQGKSAHGRGPSVFTRDPLPQLPPASSSLDILDSVAAHAVQPAGYSMANGALLVPAPLVNVPPTRESSVDSAVPELGAESKQTCDICLESADLLHFPYRCHKCASLKFCIGCIKQWFLDACQRESMMPVKCCGPIPLFVVEGLLSTEQVGSKLFHHPKALAHVAESEENVPRLPSENDLLIEEGGAGYATETDAQILKVNVTCPECQALICTSCRSLAHDEDCPMEELDLAKQLQHWKIKRCPRCRVGVSKMYGCNYVGCQCGAEFCWVCLRPADVCKKFCQEMEAPDAKDEIIGTDRHEEGDSDQSGDETDIEVPKRWDCLHEWLAHDPAFFPRAGLECHACFRHIKISDRSKSIAAEAADGSGGLILPSPAASMDGAETEHGTVFIESKIAWECKECVRVLCGYCKLLEG